MEPLTRRQARVLEFIRSFMAEHGLPPTRAEIARALEFRSPNAAEEHLRALARKGVIQVRPGMSRGIRLTGPEGAAVPVVGRVAAGAPILALEHIEEHVPLGPGLFRRGVDYLLRVRGMSMRDAGILDGDLLAVHAQPEASPGAIVVARLEDEVTVKRFRRRGHRVTLMPENPEFAPIRVDLRREELVIEGVGVGVVRDLSP